MMPPSAVTEEPPTLSIVVPVYNEALRLEGTVPQLVSYLRQAPFGSELVVVDWSFDTELVFLATALGLRVEELPVRWRDDARTKVRLGRDIVGSLSGLLAICVNRLTRRYDLPR